MSEEGEILSLGAVRISLYQCPPPSTAVSGTHSCYGTVKAYRGDVLIPFYKGSTTYRDLTEGLEFRLNQYSVLHMAPDASGSHNNTGQQQVPVHIKEASMNNEGCCFTGEYLCPRCSGNGLFSTEGIPTSRKRQRSVRGMEYPKVTVRNFSRVQCSWSDTAPSPSSLFPSPDLHEPVDVSALVTEDDLGCFFYCTMESYPTVSPPLSLMSRPVVGRDHVREYASESAYDDASPRRIELKMGERLLRVGVSAGQRFADVFERLRRRRLHVHRLFDGASGASILPCELVRHLSWRVAALCADAAPEAHEAPDGSYGSYGAYGAQGAQGAQGDPGHSAASLISLSAAGSGPYGTGGIEGPRWGGGPRGIGLESSASGATDGRRRGRQEEQQQQQQQQLLWQTSFGFGGEGEDTVVVDLLSPRSRLLKSRSKSRPGSGSATRELSEGYTPFRAVYLDDESCDDGTGIRAWRRGDAEEFPIMVTQQALPEFFGDEDDDDDDDDDDDEDSDD